MPFSWKTFPKEDYKIQISKISVENAKQSKKL